VPLSALSWHRFTQQENEEWAAMPASRQVIASSYMSSDGIRYHLHQVLHGGVSVPSFHHF
jgi:hypothetical protein